MEKEELINYVLLHSNNYKKSDLAKLGIESLVIIKVQLELEINKNKIT